MDFALIPPEDSLRLDERQRAIEIIWKHYNSLMDNHVWSDITSHMVRSMLADVVKEIDGISSSRTD